jgi:hypothetical protein
MLEEKLRGEVQRMLRTIGFNDYHPPDLSFKGAPINGVSVGRPDIYCLNTMGPSIVCEVKTIQPLVKKEPWFDPSKISDKQRAWLDWWTYGRKGAGFLAIGTTWSPRAMWLVPWRAWVDLEYKIAERDSAPISPDPNDQRAVTMEFYPPTRITLSDIDNSFTLYQCEWVVGGAWYPKSHHPINTIPTMLHLKEQWCTMSYRYEKEKA